VKSLATIASLGALAVFTSGCYWSSPPTRPHGHQELVIAELQDLSDSAAVPPLRSQRLVVLGRFDNLSTQPIGGLYDEVDYSISPLYRTYFFRDAHLEVFEHVSDALRAAGLDVRKDYATAGEPALVEPRIRQQNPLLVSGVVKTLQHDQIRVNEPAPHEFEIARLVIGVKVSDIEGHVVYDRELRIQGKRPARPDSDLLRTLGRALGAALASDPAFRRAVGAA
jgi:hypothetical protein